MSEAGNLSEYTPSVDEMVRALSYWGHMTREEARAAVNRRIDFIEAEALREAASEWHGSTRRWLLDCDPRRPEARP